MKEENDETKEALQEKDKEKQVETVEIGENEREKVDKPIGKYAIVILSSLSLSCPVTKVNITQDIQF